MSSCGPALGLLLSEPAADHTAGLVELALGEVELSQADPRALLHQPPEYAQFLQLQVDLVQVLCLLARMDGSDDELQDVQRDPVDALAEGSPR